MCLNAVIVKQGREVNFYAMPTGGRGGDWNLDLETGVPDDGVDGLEINAVSFCYGISINEEPPADTLSACPLNNESETYCGEGEAFECNVIDGRLECCSCNGDLAGCLIEEASLADGGCGSITFTELHPAFTGKGSDIVCYKTKKGLTCWEY